MGVMVGKLVEGCCLTAMRRVVGDLPVRWPSWLASRFTCTVPVLPFLHSHLVMMFRKIEGMKPMIGEPCDRGRKAGSLS